MLFHSQRVQSKPKKSIIMIMRALGAFSASVFAIAIPSIYFATSITAVKQTLTLEAAYVARSIGKIIQTRPDLWEFESVRLREIISKPLIHNVAHEGEIRTAAGKLVIKTDFTDARPIISVSAPFFDSGQLAGSILIIHSIRTQIITTALLGILSSLFGCLIYYIFRTYPIRKLENTLTDLQRARDELEQRVADRIQALQRVRILLERERKQNELLSASPIIIYRCEPKNNFPATFITENIRNQLGYEPHEFTGEADFWASHIHPDDAPYIFSGLSNLFERGYHTHEYRFLHKDGTYRWMYDEVRLIYGIDGKPTDIVGTLIDITERKQTEETLLASEARFKALVESSSDRIWEVDANGVYTYASPKVKDLLGYEPEEVIGKTPFDFMPPEEAKRMKSEFGAIATSQKSFRGLENTNIHKDGSLVVLDTSGVPFFDPNVKFCGYRGIDRDITERKRSGEALKKSYDDLKNLQARLIQSGKLASIGELAAGVAHELNQPLMIIRTTAQLMLRKQSKNSLDTVKLLENLNSIEKNTKRMMNIINHLRTFSRQTKSEFTPVSVNKIIQDSFLMIGEQLSLRNIEVIQDLSNDLPKVQGDANQLEQVFLNLLTNARDAILTRDENVGWITIVTRYAVGNHQSTPAEYSKDSTGQAITNQQSRGFIEILVRDSGGGIPQETLKDIFDPFYTTKEVDKGTGLGLSISYGIIQDHKGEIDVAETGLEGTTFRISLPVS
jgi:two-component system, NtrC family, sensor kinase